MWELPPQINKYMSMEKKSWRVQKSKLVHKHIQREVKTLDFGATKMESLVTDYCIGEG